MKKLSIAIDMGAKNNGVFIVKTKDKEVVSKKAENIIIDSRNINFSKKSRRENRHKDRNYKRRRLAKRLLKELIDFDNFDIKQQELIFGLLNNRGYTFLSTEVEFEKFSDETPSFNKKYLPQISEFETKDKFEEYFTNEFEDEKDLLNFLDSQISLIKQFSTDLQNFINKDKILKDLDSIKEGEIPVKFKNFSYIKNLLYKYKYQNIGRNEKEIMQNILKDDFDKSKIDFEKEFDYANALNFEKEDKDNKKIIQDDLRHLADFFTGVKKEIETGSKPRKKYLKDIKEEIDNLDFIEDKKSFYNLIGNISNLQLRVLRKFFNNNSSHKDKYEILKGYFKAFHYKKDNEKKTRIKLFNELENHLDFKKFLQTCDPLLTIPPYEDMNNRDTYKCNSMLIKPSLIDDDLKYAIDTVLKNKNFSNLLIADDGEFKKEENFRVRPKSGNIYEKTDYTYSKYLQRILDTTPEITTKEINPRNVFKHGTMFNKGRVSSVKEFKKTFGEDIYFTLEKFASKYYEEEELIINGIYVESNSVFEKCGTNTPYKNNVKHIMLKPLYSYSFTKDQSDQFIEKIKHSYGLQKSLERISTEAKKYQNGFYGTVLSCFENEKCVADKEIQTIIKNLNTNLSALKQILEELNIKGSYFDTVKNIDSQNISRVLNILKQTYEILFKDLNGFSKTCKHCTKENSLRSDEKLTIGKRLLSDVAKPIDGMLDMMLERLAFEIVSKIEKKELEDISSLEIFLEQNKFEFEENLNEIKRVNNSQIKKYKREDKNRLNSNHCLYTGEKFDKGDYDHILPQSKGVYNSKANMIYASTKGNAQKGNTEYNLDMLSDEHLKDIFKTIDKKEIKENIKKGLATIKKEEFKNFDALKLTQQIALRYALFMRGTREFEKAFELVRMDKLKTITNGTQKRMARLIYEKLTKLYPRLMKDIKVNSKTIDNKLVSSTRKYLSVDQNTGEINHLFKEEKQNSHSHCIDAMVVFYLANSKLKGQKHRQTEYISELEPIFKFPDIYLDESGINNISKNKTFINSTFRQSSSIPLFQGTVYAENYYSIQKKKDNKFFSKNKELKEKNMKMLLGHGLIYKNTKNKKIFFNSLDEITFEDICKIDISKLSNLLYKLFNKKDKKSIDSLKFLDSLRYCTTRKEIVNIFFDDKFIKLTEFEKIKDIPPFSKNLFKAVYKRLNSTQNLFKVNEEGKQNLDHKVLTGILKDIFDSKQKEDAKQKRKRGKKRHKYTLPCLGQNAKYKIKRGNIWQVLGGENIATKNYIINGEIKPIPYFTKNTLPLKIADLSDCLLFDENTDPIYKIPIDVSKFDEIGKLTYFLSEASRHTVEVVFNKSYFLDIEFEKIQIFDCTKDEVFREFVDKYIEGEFGFCDLVNSMRNNKLDKKNGGKNKELKAVATLLENNKNTISLRYKAETNSGKKQIILNNLKD